MFNDKTSLILCGVLVAVIFCTGVLQVLDNYIVLTVISVLFLTILYNIIYTKQNLK
ncbi:hypothetical protein JCM19300_3163 [Algibacter lectus]|uniref:Uncharacterized protein n=1 Tax=Algibacter lectus TaxID=221126 RepID=A0A090VGS2_9FLAO|nr:hypothetical protein JCM19300_3163 [Algibacter lectus]